MPTRLIDSTPPPIDELMLAGHDLRGGEVHGVEAGGAEAVDLHAGHGLAETGLERREARDVAAGLADRIDHAEHDVVDRIFRQIVAVLQRLQRHGGERQRGDFVQRAVRLAAAARGANVIVDECLGHDALLICCSNFDSAEAGSERFRRQFHDRGAAGLDAREMGRGLRQHPLHEEAAGHELGRADRASPRWRQSWPASTFAIFAHM